jgi:hypothetical protein
MVKKLFLTSLSFLVAVFLLVTTAHAAYVFFELEGDAATPGGLDITYNPGDTFSLDLYLQITDIEDGESGLYGGMFDIYFDDSILEFDGGSTNDTLWDPNWSWVNDAGGKLEVNVTDYWDQSQPYGDLLLATLDFTVAGTGTADLPMDFRAPEATNNFLTWDDQGIDHLIEFNSATVTAVPGPGPVLLTICGLGIGILGMRRRPQG